MYAISKCPVARAGRGVGLTNFARQGNEGHGEIFGDGFNGGARCVDDVDTSLGGGVNVDVIHANAVATYDFEARRAVHYWSVDDASGACEYAVCVFDRGDDLIGFKSFRPEDFAVVFEEVILSTGVYGFKEQDVEFCHSAFLLCEIPNHIGPGEKVGAAGLEPATVGITACGL